MESVDLLREAKLIRSEVFFDERGYFLETYQKPLYQSLGIDCDFVQDNHSFSKKGTLRGMHFQHFPGQAKLIRVLCGEIFDVIVDIRPHSPTFRRWAGVHLKDEAHEQLFIPVGFAHGFCVLSETAHVCYKVSSVYDPDQERGFRYDDPEIGIKWPSLKVFLSQRDVKAPYFHEVIK
jgi:dTDP-4-dehydrorhamnose 3,5-epimerase